MVTYGKKGSPMAKSASSRSHSSSGKSKAKKTTATKKSTSAKRSPTTKKSTSAKKTSAVKKSTVAKKPRKSLQKLKPHGHKTRNMMGRGFDYDYENQSIQENPSEQHSRRHRDREGQDFDRLF